MKFEQEMGNILKIKRVGGDQRKDEYTGSSEAYSVLGWGFGRVESIQCSLLPVLRQHCP